MWSFFIRRSALLHELPHYLSSQKYPPAQSTHWKEKASVCKKKKVSAVHTNQCQYCLATTVTALWDGNGCREEKEDAIRETNLCGGFLSFKVRNTHNWWRSIRVKCMIDQGRELRRTMSFSFTSKGQGHCRRTGCCRKIPQYMLFLMERNINSTTAGSLLFFFLLYIPVSLQKCSWRKAVQQFVSTTA